MARVKLIGRTPALFAAAFLAMPAAAFGQDDGSADAADTASETTDDGAADAAPAAEPDTTLKLTGMNPEAPFPRISDNEETIFAVQRKAFLMKSRLEISPYFAFSVADRFVTTYAPAASVVYHLSENLGVELYGSYMLPSESSLTVELIDKFTLRGEIAKLTQMLWTAGVGLQWSPIYGKIQIFGEYLGNFSFYIGAGIGLGETRVQCTNREALDPNRGFPTAQYPDPNDVPNATERVDTAVCNANGAQVPDENGLGVYEPNTLRPMAAISGGVRFDFLSWLSLKLEVKDYIFVARVYRPVAGEGTPLTDAVRNNIFMQVGLSFLLGGEED